MSLLCIIEQASEWEKNRDWRRKSPCINLPCLPTCWQLHCTSYHTQLLKLFSTLEQKKDVLNSHLITFFLNKIFPLTWNWYRRIKLHLAITESSFKNFLWSPGDSFLRLSYVSAIRRKKKGLKKKVCNKRAWTYGSCDSK